MTSAAALLLLATAHGCAGDDGNSKTTASSSAPPRPVARTLADGSAPSPMPDALRRFRGRPVIQSKELPGQAAELFCSADGTPAAGRQPAAAWISTDGLSVVYAPVGDASGVYVCEALWDGERWDQCAFTLTENETQAGQAAVCTDGDPPRAFMWLTVPQGVAWALVDHRSFWVAYLAANRPVLRISATEGASDDGLAPTKVALVNQRGRVLGEQTLEGDRAER